MLSIRNLLYSIGSVAFVLVKHTFGMRLLPTCSVHNPSSHVSILPNQNVKMAGRDELVRRESVLGKIQPSDLFCLNNPGGRQEYYVMRWRTRSGMTRGCARWSRLWRLRRPDWLKWDGMVWLAKSVCAYACRLLACARKVVDASSFFSIILNLLMYT